MSGLLILGAAGDGKVVAEVALDLAARGEGPTPVGFLDDRLPTGTICHGLPVVGSLAQWRDAAADTLFVAALHKIKQMVGRCALIESLGIPEDRWATVIHPTARIARYVEVGAGSFVAQYVVVQPGASIGRHVSIRAGANIGHDARVGDFAYIGPNASLCGTAEMAHAAHLGPNGVIVEGVSVGEYSVVGVASAVTKHIGPRRVVFGTPARFVGGVD